VVDAWSEAEAHRLEPLVDGLSAVVLVGSDSAATAEVAVALGRAQAARRHVTIGDLIGELPGLEGLIAHDDPHGLSDALTYGISLARVGYPVSGVRNLYVAPSGTDPVCSESILAHPRWPRLVAGIRAKGALLVLVADPRAPGVRRLIEATDGAIVVGDALIEGADQVLARTPPRGIRRIPVPAEDVSTPSSTSSSPTVQPPADTPTPAAEPEALPPDTRRRSSLLLVAAAVIAGVGFIALLASGWRRTAQTDPPPFAGAVPATAALAPAADPPPPVENPAAEEDASAYSLVLRTANTRAGASDNLLRLVDLPAATMAPSLDGTGLWYKVLAGAYAERAQAESLQAKLGRDGRAGADVEAIAFLPFALVVDDSVQIDSAVAVSARLREQGIPAYPLIQADSLARIFAGAFGTPAEAMHLAPVLRAAGIRPRIAYRTGRPL
jgi:hypothetical protein